MPADIDIQVKLAVYREFAESGRAPNCGRVAARTGLSADAVLGAFQSLRAQRLIWLEPDGATIRMAPPFSGVPTQHRVQADGVDYYANCAWDALGVIAALHRPGRVRSRCEQSGEALNLDVGENGPEPSTWVYHCLVPAARWWDDLVFT